jgi:GNAT superfamily N-acetyltransferase
MNGFTIEEAAIPSSIDAPDAADFIEMTRVRNEIEAETVGNYDLAYEPAELLPGWQDPYEPQRLLLARVDGSIVGRGIYSAPIEDGSREVWLEAQVHPRFRGRGIGAALYDQLARWAAEDQRSVLQCYVLHGNAEGERIPSPTGFGSAPRNTPETRFLLARGYALEQVERLSRLALPVDADRLSSYLSAAQAVAGADYRTVWWEGRTPERWLGDIAGLHSSMSTDAPSAAMDVAAENWDAERMRTIEDLDQSNPRTLLVSAIEHVPSERLVAFNELSVPPQTQRAVEQQDTIVLKEHRGHRLGMLVKSANLIRLHERHPGHPSITTFNAEENRHMLDVNEALGFVAVGYGGGWKKTL